MSEATHDPSSIRSQLERIEKRTRVASQPHRGDFVQTTIVVAGFAVVTIAVVGWIFTAIFGIASDTAQCITMPMSGIADKATEAVCSGAEIEKKYHINGFNMMYFNIPMTILSLIFLGFYGHLIRQRRRIDLLIARDRKKNMLAAQQQYKTYVDQIIGEIETIVLNRGKKEMDLEYIFHAPEFIDPKNPVIQKLNASQKDAVRLCEILKVTKVGALTNDHVSDLLDKKEEFAASLDNAIRHCENVGWRRASIKEKKLLNRAQDLLAIASSEQSNDFERRNALSALTNVIDTLRDDYGRRIPTTRVTAAIESFTARYLLTS